MGFSVCFPKAEAQAQTLVVVSCLQHRGKHCKTAMAYETGDWKKYFLPSFEGFRACSEHF